MGSLSSPQQAPHSLLPMSSTHTTEHAVLLTCWTAPLMQGPGQCRGQGGDHLIAQDVTPQFTAGWDWQQPVRDRSTGIWDAVVVRYTGPVLLRDVHAAVYRAGGEVPLSETAAVHLQLGLSCTGIKLPG